VTKLGKIFAKVCAALVFLTIILAIAHSLLFPQETRSILIGFSYFRDHGRRVYSRAQTPEVKIDSLKSLIDRASIRIKDFWGEQRGDPKFIYCASEDDFKEYAINPAAPAVTYLKLGAVIVLSNSAMDVDIIAHELSHVELYERIGFYRFTYKIPAWFKHGLAMQNDYRNYYSEDTLRARTDNFLNLPDVRIDTTDAQFYSGSQDQVMLRYMAAKHVVRDWYTPEKLRRLIADLNSGKGFREAYPG
jgi:hypothetical protein